MFIRKVKNHSGNTVFQVVKKVKRKNCIVKHLGTARNDLEKQQLLELGQAYLDRERLKQGRPSLFDSRYSQSEGKQLLKRFAFKETRDSVTYNFFRFFYRQLGFDSLHDEIFGDLVVTRIMKPVSKVKTRDFLETVLGRKYSLTGLYRAMQAACQRNYRTKVEKILWDYCFPHKESVSTLFFDVTTLYFEAFDEDEFKRKGFSKDNKANQPQVTVTLTVTASGFPLHLQSFEGNKFEGHTIIPCLLSLKTRHRINNFIVVADSAMLSEDNLDGLGKQGLKFIVGARLGNLSPALFQQIVNSVEKTDGTTARFRLGNSRTLIVSYSRQRADKDKSDREKQVKKANYALQKPSTVSQRFKFLKRAKGKDFILNEQLIEKAKQLEGLKGYVTNDASLTDQEITEKYAQLWQVEKSFRMSKSDLKARPIFHTVREKIEAHLLIVFCALAVMRLVENQTKLSTAKILEKLNLIKEIIIEDRITGERFSQFIEPNEEAKQLFQLARINWVT